MNKENDSYVRRLSCMIDVHVEYEEFQSICSWSGLHPLHYLLQDQWEIND